MSQWISSAINGFKNDHEETFIFGKRALYGNLWLAIRLLHKLGSNNEKNLEFQAGFCNPTASSFLLNLDWSLNTLGGKDQIYVEKARGFKASYRETAMACLKAPIGEKVQGNVVISDSKRSIQCMTECCH